LNKGEFNPVPIVIGTNLNETTTIFPLAPNATLDEVNQIFGVLLGPTLTSLLPYYYDSSLPPYVYFNQISTDANFLCPTRAFARRFAAAKVPVYRYLFDYELEYVEENCPYLGTPHTEDLLFVFNSSCFIGIASFVPVTVTKSEQDFFSPLFQQYWNSFATTGSPNKEGDLPFWPRYNLQTEKVLNISEPVGRLPKDFNKQRCDFWDVVLESQSLTNTINLEYPLFTP